MFDDIEGKVSFLDLKSAQNIDVMFYRRDIDPEMKGDDDTVYEVSDQWMPHARAYRRQNPAAHRDGFDIDFVCAGPVPGKQSLICLCEKWTVKLYHGIPDTLYIRNVG
jgi:hypothetical protein